MHDDPFAQFGAWWDDEPVPMLLATASADGAPFARAVVLEQHDAGGFVFWTSAESPTGLQLAANPRAAIVWLWDGRQARVEGNVEPVTEAENDRHWAARRQRRPLVAFHQSEPVAGRAELEAMLDGIPDDAPRPWFWIGYRVVPERFDFWAAHADGVHDRFEYTRDGGGWSRRRLQP
jgi:pyridoxamine 5'-phosphate oxidase